MCLRCGDTRWSFFTRPADGDLKPCELCGGETVIERRRPRIGPPRVGVERREALPAGAAREREPR